MTLRSITLENKTKLINTAGYYAALVGLGMLASVVGPTISGLAENTHTRLDQISLVFAARALGYLLGALFGGRLYDRRPGHPVAAGVLASAAVLLAFVPVIPLLWLLVLLMLLMGISEGILDVGCNSLLIWVHGAKVGPFMNGLHFFFGVGTFISPIIIAQAILVSGDFRWAYWLITILILPVAFWIYRLPSPPHQREAQVAETGKIRPLLVALITLFYFLFIGMEAGFGNWIYTYATKMQLADKITATYITSLFWGSFTLGRLLGIPIAARFRPRTILFWDLVGCVVCTAIYLIWPQSKAVLWAGAVGAGLFQASLFATMLVWAERRIALTGRINGFFFMGSGASGMFFPWLMGQLIEPRGPQVIMVIILAEAVFTLILLGVLLWYAPRPVRVENQP